MNKRKAATSLDLHQKAKIIELCASNGKTQKQIPADYKISQSTVTGILKSKDKILASLGSASITPKVKRMRTAKHVDVESALLEWLIKNRNSNIPFLDLFSSKKQNP